MAPTFNQIDQGGAKPRKRKTVISQIGAAVGGGSAVASVGSSVGKSVSGGVTSSGATTARAPSATTPAQREAKVKRRTLRKIIAKKPKAAAGRKAAKRIEARATPERKVKLGLAPKPAKKVAVAVPEIVPPKYRKAVAKQGQRLNDALREKGSDLSGPEYLGKLIQFESGWDKKAEGPPTPYGTAKGLGQFIPPTAADFESRLGVDPDNPRKPKQMVKGAAMHASGKHGYGALYDGYNPGYGSDPIPSVDSGANVKVKISKKAAKRVAGGKVSTAATPEKFKGAYEGAQRAALRVIPKPVRAEGRGDKRTPSENAAVGGAADSDHLTTNTGSYGADIPPDTKTYNRIQRKLGLPVTQTGSQTITKDGYRYQLIFGSEYGHGDHIHLGAEWTGAAASAPAGGAGAAVGGMVGSGTSTAPSGQPAGDRKKVRRYNAERKRRKQLLEQIIAKEPTKTSQAPTPQPPPTPEKREMVRLGL